MLACQISQLHEDINGDGLKLIAYLAYIPDRCISTFMISSISSGINSIDDFSMCEDEHSVCTQCKSVLHISVPFFPCLHS